MLAAWTIAPAEPVEEEISFDDLTDEEAPPPAAGVAPAVRLMGRFDLALERRGDAFEMTSYHQFVFLRAASPDGRLSFMGEVLGGWFHEIGIVPLEGHRLKVGKVLVPFGADPYHHRYGGVWNLEYETLLLPLVWGEYGAVYSPPEISRGRWRIALDLFGGKGVSGDPGSTIKIRVPDSGDAFAAATRIGLQGGGLGSLHASGYVSQYDDSRMLLLYGLEGSLDYGALALPLLRHCRWEAGFARMDVEDPLDDDRFYYQHGDYAQLTWGKWRQKVRLIGRYGTYIDNSRIVSNADRHVWTAAAEFPWDVGSYRLTYIVQYQWRMEEVNEVDDDLARLHIALDF